MKKSKQLTEEKILAIEEQIQRESVPYVYDTKEYPVEVIVAKYEKEQINKDQTYKTIELIIVELVSCDIYFTLHHHCLGDTSGLDFMHISRCIFVFCEITYSANPVRGHKRSVGSQFREHAHDPRADTLCLGLIGALIAAEINLHTIATHLLMHTC